MLYQHTKCGFFLSRLTYKPPGGDFNGEVIAGKKPKCASPTLIIAARRLLAPALLEDQSITFVALVSQHCIHLYSFRLFYRSYLLHLVPSHQRRDVSSTRKITV